MNSEIIKALNARKEPLFLVRGLPGSGKTTFAKLLKQCIEDTSLSHPKAPFTHAHTFENDEFFVSPKDGEYKFDRSLCGIAANWNLGRVAHSLIHHAGEPCIVSNTFTTFDEIKPYMNLASYFGLWLVVFRMDTMYGNVHRVPDEVVDSMRERMNKWNFRNEIHVNCDNDKDIAAAVAKWYCDSFFNAQDKGVNQ